MMVPTLILDTNVIVSALRSSLGASHRLLQLLDQGAFEIGLTAPLVFEYEAVCKRMTMAPVTTEDVDRFIDYLCRVGKQSVADFQLRPHLPDPDDDMILEAAIASGSDWIVTHSVRDLAAGSSRYGVDVLTPADALRLMGVAR